MVWADNTIFWFDCIDSLHSKFHVIPEVTVHQPRAGIISEHLHRLGCGRKYLYDVIAVSLVRAVYKRLTVKVDRMNVSRTAETKNVPGNRLSFRHG